MPVPEFALSGRRFLLRLRDLHLPRPALAHHAGPAVRRALLVPACASLALAAACGGGGADSPTTPPPPPPPAGPSAPATAVATGATSVIGRAGEALTGPFGVTVRDARGTAVPNVSVACAVESGGGSIGATSTTTASDGSASCGAWTLGGTLGSQALRVTVGALAPVQFAATVTAGPVAFLTVEQPLSTTVRSGVAPTARPIIRVRDRFGNDVAEAGISVTAAVANATLAGATAITNASGRAEFTALVVSGLAGARTISFTAPGASAPVTGQFTLEAGLAAVVAFVTPPPTTLAAGAIVAPAVQVALRDDAGNPVAETGRAVTATVSGATVANGIATTGADGRATFTGLTIGGVVGARSLVVTGASLVQPATAPFTLTPGAATALTLETAAPTGVRSGVPLSTAPQLQLRDAFGNAVPAAGVAVSASVASATIASATLSNATAQTDATGRATFTGLTVSGLVGARTLAFTAGALTAPSPVAFTLQSGPAAVLAVVRDAPPSLTSGFELALPPIVQLRDAAGNDADDAGVAVRAVATGSALTLVNATAVTNAIGRATFTGLGAVATAGAASFRYESGSLPPVTAATTSIVAPAGDQVPATIEFGAPAARVIVLDPGQAQTPGLVVRNGAGVALSGALVERVSRDAVIAATWAPLVDLFPDAGAGRVEMATSAADPDALWIVAERLSDARLLGLHRWHPQSGIQKLNAGNLYTGAARMDFGTQSWWNLVVAVDPANAQRIYIGGARAYRSDDGGNSFTEMASNIHVDWHAIAVHPTDPRRVFAGNDGGLVVSTDGGTTFTSRNGGVATMLFFRASRSIPPFPATCSAERKTTGRCVRGSSPCSKGLRAVTAASRRSTRRTPRSCGPLASGRTKPTASTASAEAAW